MSQPITSLKNPRVRQAARLRRAAQRRKQERILIDGVREIGRALAGGVELLELFSCPAVLDAAGSELIAAARERGVFCVETTPEVFAQLAYGERCEGVVAVARGPALTLDQLALPERPLVAVLEQVEKPGNLGAICRTADGAGLDAVLLADPLTSALNPNAIRASLGTVFSLPLAEADQAQTLAWLRERSLQIVAARVDAEVDYDQINYCQPTAIVLGSEAEGLSGAWCAEDIVAVRLPMLGAADSLNVSAAAAVLFYEARRQRRVALPEPARANAAS